METRNFALLPDLVLIELFSCFTSVELLHSFWSLTSRLDHLLFDCNVIRHVDWLNLSDHYRDVTRDRLFSVASLATDCLSIAEPLLERKTLRRLSLVDVLPRKLMEYSRRDRLNALNGLQEINFTVTNSSIPSKSDSNGIGLLLAYCIGYVPTLHTVHLPPSYRVDNFGMPPVTVGNIQCCKYYQSKLVLFISQVS